MPFLRGAARVLLLALLVAAGLTPSVAASPLRSLANSDIQQAQGAIGAQAQALLPQFGRRDGPHPPLGLPQQTGVQLDHSGTRANSRPVVLKILKAAAGRHQLDPRLVVALSYWESGWDQSKVSVTGAVGLMQVEPPTAAEAGPALLGRPVNVEDPVDNADVGAAVLREDLNNFGTPDLALAAYYQGPTSVRQNGMLPDTQAYVAGILALAARLNV